MGAGSRFGEQIAHGLLVLSFASGLMPFDPERIVALRRVGDAVFKQPVMIGDTVHVEGEVAGRGEIDDDNGLVECRWRVLNQHGRMVHAGVGRAGLATRRGARADTALAMLLDGKRLLVTGVLTRGSIAYSVAERAQQEGAEVVLTGFGRTRRMTERAAARLPRSAGGARARRQLARTDLAALASSLGHVDGALHAIAFAPGDALGGNFLSAPPESAEIAFRTSAYSFKALGRGAGPADGRPGRLVRRHGLRRLCGVAGV